MKKSAQVRLGLMASAAVLVSGCQQSAPAPDEQWNAPPEQQVRAYCDSLNPEQCSSTPRAGYLPFFYPLYLGGTSYYDARGRYHASGAPQSLIRQSGGYRAPSAAGAGASRSGATARGGFGSTGAGRGATS